MPGLVEAADGKMYVVKMRGAGQGPLVLAAEVIVGELARTLGLHVPEIALVELQGNFGTQERDPEIRSLLRASTGLNAGLQFLPGATTFDSAAGDTASAEMASLTVWLDAFTMNVDRTARNPNLLRQAGKTWLIDHGAALYFHHDWPSAQAKIASSFALVREHVLLPWVGDFSAASALARERVEVGELERVVRLVPDDWLTGDGEVSADEARERYLRFLTARLQQAAVFEEEVLRVRSSAV